MPLTIPELNISNISENNDNNWADESQVDGQVRHPPMSTDEGLHTLNMLHHEGIPSLEVYSDDNIISFDKWGKKFLERIKVFGIKLSEEEKLARLSLFLEDTPKRIFEELSPTQKLTCEMALQSIRKELDSPQRRALSRQALLMCRQHEGESVKDFLSRFRPLAMATAADISGPNKERYLCELLLERLRPNIAFCMKLLNFSQTDRGFEQLCLDLREVEIMLPGGTGSMFDMPNQEVHAMQQSNPFNVPGKFQSLNPTNPNRQKLGQRQHNPRRDMNYRDTRQMRTPTNDRRWNNRPICNYCSKVGHFANVCRTRIADFQTQRGQGRREPDVGPSNMSNDSGMLKEILSTLKNMQVGSSKNNGSSQNVNLLHGETKPINEEPEEKQSNVEKEKPSIVSWEPFKLSPKLLPMVILVLALATPLQAMERLSIPQYPMICQTEKQPTLWSLPDMTDCPIPSPNISHVPISQTRNVYMLNDLEYTTQGWACRKIRKTLRKFTTLSNVPINEPVGSETLPVGEQECSKMIKDKECSLGKLTEENNLWTTSNKIDSSPKMWFIGSFWWTEVQSENCLLFSVQINSHWGEEGIGTSFGESNNCSYSKGLCVLSDNTILKWEPTKDRMCRYIKIGTWEGKFLDNTWLSDDAQLALHFAKPTPKFWDCSNILEISEQGLATVTSSRSKRSNNNQKLSLVTSPEMAAKLTYLDKEMADTLTFTFTHSLKTFCQNLDLVKKWALAAYLSNPTGLARMIFENDYVTAKREGSSLLRVWPCIPIKNDEYSFKATNLSECFDLIPIQFKAESREHLAFLNPLTMTIEPTARKAPCSTHGKIIVEINHEVLEVNQTSGEFRKIQPRPFNLRELKSYSIPEIKSHSFHQLMLVNLTDLKTHTFMSNLVRASEISYRIEQKDMHIVKTLSDQWKEAGNSLVTEIIGDYTWLWKVIISILIAILTLDLLIRWGIKAAENYLGQGQLGNMLFGQGRNVISRARPTSFNRNIEEIPMVKVNKNPEFKRDKTPSVKSQKRKMSWIPKVSKFPQSVETEGHTVNAMRVNKTCDKELSKDMDATASQNFSINTLQSCPTITGVFINNKAVKCLIDTGASISIAPISLARTLGLNLTPATISITSASGHEINVLAQAEVLLEIAGTKLPVTIRVVEDNQITGNRTYQLIIGCDILKRLPPITFDFNKGKINFENNFNYSDKNKSKSRNMRVAAMEAKTILPGKHGLVSVKIRTNGGEKLALVHSLDQRLEKDHLALIEAVVTPNAKENKILIANPTTEPKHICKGMHVALADEVWSIDEQPWLTQVENINVNEYVNTVEANPTFKVDFSKSSVQGEDRQKLEKLCEEFSDVFSKTQYDLGSCIAGEYDIITTTEEPITSRPHRVPFKYREELQKHIEALLKSGVMVKSDTPWVSNIVLVQKKERRSKTLH
uniref:Peptidase A2 domain-containing protein n=1 Tax=Meloidogyne incognita TaxID=6306 RepID=A0A914KG04_MELIC